MILRRYFGVIFLFLFAVSAQAQSLHVPSENDSEPEIRYGHTTAFTFESGADGIVRTNLVYMPRSLKHSTDKAKALIFLHGGGTENTADDAGAIKTAKNYIVDFTKYAEDNQIILIFPTSAFGWYRQTAYFLREFIPYLENHLPIDDRYLVLAGHSMGGMGITREYPYTTDLFSGVLGMAAGIQADMLNENALLPYFNGTPYIQLNGTDDVKFPDFLARMQKLRDEIVRLSKKLGIPSFFRFESYEGTHQYQLPRVYQSLDELFSRPKNYNPKYFTIRLGQMHTPSAEGDTGILPVPQIDGDTNERYWVKIEQYPILKVSGFIQIHVSVKDQVVTITTDDNTLNPKGIVLSLNSNLVNVTQPVQVLINGKKAFDGLLNLVNAQPQALHLSL
jgi:poly(3-hydroxybutyrate) depolymerase